jgi:ATP-dependent RNA helicase SUPV3L1/SUV3
MMIEAEPGDGEKDPLAAPAQVRHDFSVVHGFQVVGADHHVAGQDTGGDEVWRDALRLELETRAARFHHAVDSAIVLSSDGVIRWLGDPIARLSLGASILAPGALILADEALPPASRDVVRTRIELWLSAMMRRILGPLFALEALQEGSEVVRDLAVRLSRSLGILEREPIRAQVKALAQNERAELRQHGVRFGAYYIFVPALIKPAARTLALQLWGLQAAGAPDALVPALAQVASSGRTSLAFDKGISREGYRVAGYRPCGERIVRVDVLERLGGIIRAAIVESQAAAASGRAAGGASSAFVVSGQMTSLTGCAGEQFASILRSIGFRSVEMKRSEFIGSPAAVEPPQKSELSSPTEIPILAEDDRASPALAGEEERAPDSPTASPEASSSADPAPLDAAPADTAANELRSNPPEASSAVASAAPPASETSADEEKKAEMIVVWRPDRTALSRRRPGERGGRNRGGAEKGESSRIGPPANSDNAGLSAGGVEERPPNKGQRPQPPAPSAQPEARKGRRRPPESGDRPGASRPDEKHRQTPSDRDMSRPHPASERQPRAKVDPNSPFAKLLELKSLLEGQANKRP